MELRNRKDVGLPRLRQCPAPERTRQYQVQGRAGQHKLPPLPLLKYFSSWLGKLTKSARGLFHLGKLTNSAQVLFKSGKVRISSLEGPGPLCSSVYIRLWYREETYLPCNRTVSAGSVLLSLRCMLLVRKWPLKT